MSKKSKGEEFIDNYLNENEHIQELYNSIKGKSATPGDQIALTLLAEKNIQTAWKDADSKDKKD